MSLTVYRSAHFNAAHRLFREDWSDAKTRKSLVNAAILIITAIIMSWKLGLQEQ